MGKIEVGDRVYWTGAMESPDGIREGTISRVANGGSMPLAWVDGYHKAEDCIYQAYLWPIKAKADLVAALTERARLKKEYDDSMKLIYELGNRVTRGVFEAIVKKM